jgi:hypothetical protein
MLSINGIYRLCCLLIYLFTYLLIYLFTYVLLYEHQETKTKIKTLPIQPNTTEPLVTDSPSEIVEAADSVNSADNEDVSSNKKHKSQKNKVIRDSFSFPEQDYRKISELKKTCLSAGVHAKKSEILRTGLYLLTQHSQDELKQTIEKVEKLQTGRPSSKGA